MSDQKQIAPAQDLDRVRETMERNELLLSAKTQSRINDMKNLDRHFYSVGKYKAPDGTWQEKMEPDAFAVQTMGTLQQINTEVISMTWENPDDLLNAAVTVRVRGWKGPKQNPTIEKTVELRLSMKAIAAKYVMDKLEPKKKWNDASHRKEEMPAEWKEEDVTLLDNGWIQPKSYKHQIAMRSFLVDQFNFLPRMAESKAERRVNLKLLGFDWRDPDEISNESGETAAVSAAQAPAYADHQPLIDKVDACKDIAAIDALTPSLSGDLSRCSPDGQRAVIQRTKERRAELQGAPTVTADPSVPTGQFTNFPESPEGPTGVFINGKEVVHVKSEAADLQAGQVIKGPTPDDEMPEAEFTSFLDAIHSSTNPEALDDLTDLIEEKPMSILQRQTLLAAVAIVKGDLKKPKKK